MHNIQRMTRQLELLEALETVLNERGRADLTVEDKVTLVLAARIEEFADEFSENIHRAGEGI